MGERRRHLPLCRMEGLSARIRADATCRGFSTARLPNASVVPCYFDHMPITDHTAWREKRACPYPRRSPWPRARRQPRTPGLRTISRRETAYISSVLLLAPVEYGARASDGERRRLRLLPAQGPQPHPQALAMATREHAPQGLFTQPPAGGPTPQPNFSQAPGGKKRILQPYALATLRRSCRSMASNADRCTCRHRAADLSTACATLDHV